ncbi:DNA-processing protein DprA [Halomonas urumqiensis]|uniref:DNA-protecting protein DprA n=1 Tax=Halomonas urumqiensis TaxID=1684789 RepID=A0A2N7UMV8_9GAMM|nr:DNA-processing protein DprA [Halomonas urumqiensis]PMR81774.1 DNA-protecting protein DprA [Halomonas urumqiensis]PTB02411.1 DNA-protecting protein DprA [Halomonas urumqiensis]GHE21895.1 DNA processing protein DprA [Halomonas urumqiensis]
MQAREWLLLSSLPGMGAGRLAELAEHQPVWPEGWLAVLPGRAASAMRLWLEHPKRSPLDEMLARHEAWLDAEPTRQLLYAGHSAWPALLAQIPDPPPVLWADGDTGALAPPRLALVGSRRPTREGLTNAAHFASALADRGWCVVSGMALGIDAAAQQAALERGGSSIAVLGCGVDVVYPPRHHRLHARLREPGGLLLSEHPPGTVARPGFFPRRNRIVTGLSLGVLVVEAAEQSGSLVSARLAGEQGREVFALPASIHNPQASGCLRLLREGAVLVRDIDDILAELVQWCTLPVVEATPGLDEGLHDPLLRWLSGSPTPVDALVGLSGLGIAECQRRLLELELAGQVAHTAGGWVRLSGS